MIDREYAVALIGSKVEPLAPELDARASAIRDRVRPEELVPRKPIASKPGAPGRPKVRYVLRRNGIVTRHPGDELQSLGAALFGSVSPQQARAHPEALMLALQNSKPRGGIE